MHPVPCTNDNHDITDLVNYGMAENAKTWNILKTEHIYSTK